MLNFSSLSLMTNYYLYVKQLTVTLYGCSSSICDKVRQSGEGSIQAVVEFITQRGNELNESDISRFYLVPSYIFSFILFMRK